MEKFGKSHSQYLDPPEEPEAVFCEDCGKEMEQIDSFGGLRDMKCVNPYCPAKHEGVAKEMAEMLIGAEETVKSLALQLTNIRNGRDLVYGRRRD